MIDSFTINVVVAVVTITAAVLYLLETLLRREVGAGRVWALGFLSGVLTVICYLVWFASPEPWVAIAIGNAALSSTLGFFWLGCRSFNGRSLRYPAVIVGVVALVLMITTLSAGPGGGDWAGSELMFFAIAAFSLLGAVESRRGTMGGVWSSLGLTAVLVFVGAFYFVRAIVLATEGPEGPTFQTWFNSGITGLVSIVLTIAALTTATMLRSGRVTVRQDSYFRTLEISPDGLLSARSFLTALPAVVERAKVRDELFAVIALRIDDLTQISIAFGADEEAAISAQHREGARRYAPTFALIGGGSGDATLIAFLPASEADARRTASRIQRRLLDDFGDRGSAVIPVVGVGVALSRDVGYDAGRLIEAAQDAAKRSSTSPDASVILAEGDGHREGAATA
jgi:GGDEF domain-containing protein